MDREHTGALAAAIPDTGNAALDLQALVEEIGHDHPLLSLTEDVDRHVEAGDFDRAVFGGLVTP